MWSTTSFTGIGIIPVEGFQRGRGGWKLSKSSSEIHGWLDSAKPPLQPNREDCRRRGIHGWSERLDGARTGVLHLSGRFYVYRTTCLGGWFYGRLVNFRPLPTTARLSSQSTYRPPVIGFESTWELDNQNGKAPFFNSFETLISILVTAWTSRRGRLAGGHGAEFAAVQALRLKGARFEHVLAFFGNRQAARKRPQNPLAVVAAGGKLASESAARLLGNRQVSFEAARLACRHGGRPGKRAFRETWTPFLVLTLLLHRLCSVSDDT